MAKLVVISEEMKDRTFELVGDKITIGRLPDNQLRLENSTVSSHHAELTRKGEDYSVRDLNSTNGTRVNDQRIVETRLYHGDVITLGHLQLQYLSAAKGTPQPLPSPLKKTVDLSGLSPNSTTRPTTYGSSSPFARHRRGGSKMFLQAVIVILGLIAIVLLAFFITTILNV